VQRGLSRAQPVSIVAAAMDKILGCPQHHENAAKKYGGLWVISQGNHMFGCGLDIEGTKKEKKSSCGTRNVREKVIQYRHRAPEYRAPEEEEPGRNR